MASLLQINPITPIQQQHHPSRDLVLHNDTQCQRQQPPTPLHHQPMTRWQPRQYQPFRLLDLPVELQRLIYVFYHDQTWSVTLDYERLSMLRTSFHIKGSPSPSLLRVSRAVHAVASEVRHATFTGRLTLNSVFTLIPLRKKPEFDWLKRHVRTLHFSDASVRPERWGRYYANFERLRRLEIDFPSVVVLAREECVDLDPVMDGRCDAVLVANLEPFRDALVGELGEGVDVVVCQRYRLTMDLSTRGWKGFLSVKVQLSSHGTRVLERTHDPDVEIMSKIQFARHEL